MRVGKEAEVVRNGDDEDNVSDLYCQSLEEDGLRAGVVEIGDLDERKRISVRPTSFRQRDPRRATVHTRTKRRMEGNPVSIPKCATHYQIHPNCYFVVPLRDGKRMGDCQPVAMHFKIGAVVGGDQKDLDSGHNEDRLHTAQQFF